METVVIPKIMMYVFNLMVIIWILSGISWIIKLIKHKREQKFNAAMDRMSKHYVDDSVKHPTFANAVCDIPYADAVKVYMLYEKYKVKHIKETQKWLKKQERRIENAE